MLFSDFQGSCKKKFTFYLYDIKHFCTASEQVSGAIKHIEQLCTGPTPPINKI